jgi:carboxypeptidase Taq
VTTADAAAGLAAGSPALAALITRFRRIRALDHALGILDWDTETMMADGAAESRALATSGLKVLRHELLTAPEVAGWLDDAQGEVDRRARDEATAWDAADLREMRRVRAHATAVPGDLVEAQSQAASRCEMAWREARARGDEAGILPRLRELVARVRDSARAKASALGCSPYEALADEFEPGYSQPLVDAIFGELGVALPPLVTAAVERSDAALARLGHDPAQGVRGFSRDVPAEEQRALALELMADLGFDFRRGRLDLSVHPFCGGADDDVRITTRFDPANPLRGLFGVLHETGHALYEQGRPAGFRGRPVGDARGMAVHESQSLFVEMQIARSDAFLAFAGPKLARVWRLDAGETSVEQLAPRVRAVRRSTIRVDADEVTYPLHVLLRTRLEREVIEGRMEVDDLPDAFREGLSAALGVTAADPREGFLQDIHWFVGLWGYFPSYTIGALLAAQLRSAISQALPELDELVARGQFLELREALAARVHRQGSLKTTPELIAQATGQPLTAGPFLSHLRARYTA